MNRRKLLTAAIVGSVALGLAALAGLAGHYAIPREDDEEGGEPDSERRR